MRSSPGRPQVEQVLGLFAERLRRRVPVAYLMGRMWFAGLEFEVDQRVIVPRSPFAELIASAASRPGSIRRACGGSSISAPARAASPSRARCAFPQARVDAVDLSPDALEVAARNVQRHGVGARLQLHLGDMFEPLGDAVYDLIVSNPPYVSDAEMAALPARVPARAGHGACAPAATGSTSCVGSCAMPMRTSRRAASWWSKWATATSACSRPIRGVPFLWLEFEHGGGGVFLLTKDDLPQAPS